MIRALPVFVALLFLGMSLAGCQEPKTLTRAECDAQIKFVAKMVALNPRWEPFVGGDSQGYDKAEKERKTKPRVALWVSGLEAVKSQMIAGLTQALYRVPGLQVVTSKPHYTVSIVVVEIGSSGRRMGYAMGIDFWEVLPCGNLCLSQSVQTCSEERLTQTCNEIGAHFDAKVLAPLR